MCQAFHKIGANITLALPACNRKNRETNLNVAIEERLGIRPNFKIKTYHGFSVRRQFKGVGANIGARVLLRNSSKPDICFVRSIFLSRLLLNHGYKTAYEAHASVLNSRSKLFDRIYKRRLLKDVNRKDFVLFIAISHALADVWRKRGVPSNKLIALHDCVNADDYNRVMEKKEARDVLGLPVGKKIAIYAGSLYGDRKTDDILKLAEKYKDVLFYVVGGPEERKTIYRSLSEQKGLTNIYFTGYVPHKDVKTYLLAADILLMLWSRSVPTIEICSPLKVFEYMAAERIIVGHGFPTIKEVLEDGVTAILCDPDSYNDLENKFKYALSRSYPNDMAKKARETVFKYYTWELRAKAILDAVRIN